MARTLAALILQLMSATSALQPTSRASRRARSYTKRLALDARQDAAKCTLDTRSGAAPDVPGDAARSRRGENAAATSRRGLLAASAAAALFSRAPAFAYPNAIPEAAKYADRKKRRGPVPQDLGLKMRDASDSEVPELQICQGPAPNCFSTTQDSFTDEHTIPLWKAPKKSRADLVADLEATLKAYPPGQAGIDGGGFEIDKASKGGYFLVRYESLKNGYIDDLELALSDAEPYVLRARSSSRVGFLDFEVNAKRLNRLGADLKARGWATAEITPKTH
eukprot:CAMPEP_0119266448 /NCGR_PEP_ID=MMETSP1329-20130426/4935_1 /TAXON_ID=114041 /ORGANISM="Genus nov. species nov., Strain RCC1024" /LENGTH=277 /DNA_ID=CAMNT_0007266327 /DNA_START=70 /DNA_END=900 /DNA_ORIENTATION=+